MDLAELLTLETSVLRTLCLTVNEESSELGTRAAEALNEHDFYFPITRSIFSAISNLHRGGTSVDATSLQKALGRGSVDVPDDFFLEDLFSGEAPSPRTWKGWVEILKTRNEMVPAQGRDPARGKLESTHPSVEADWEELSRPIPPDTEEVETDIETDEPDEARVELSSASPEPPRAEPPPPPPPAPTPGRRERSTESASDQGPLSPESGEWLRYLSELTKRQGEQLRTGFAGLDAEWGGLGSGFVLLAGNQSSRLLDFLKQLVDQIASRCRVPCLYLSFERSKTELRLLTLSRLSGAPAAHIREGRYDKNSAEWQGVIRTGERAVEWLQRIYTVEARPGLAVSAIRELRQGLIGSGAGATCMIAVDNLHKLASESDLLQSVAELKELAESLGILVIGVAEDFELVHERSADIALSFSDEDGVSVVEVSASGSTEPSVLRFDYRPETHAFEELG